MIQRLIPMVVVLLCTSVYSFGQTPRNINIQKSTNTATSSFEKSMMCDAGTISFVFDGQSSDADGIVKYLCADDCLTILHDNNSLIDDPQPATDAGIGYVFYDTPPSVTGPTIDDVINDPSANTDSIRVGNTFVQPNLGIWLATDQQNGDAKFTNNGSLQLAYASQNPVQFWFAPITVHDFPTQGFETNGAGTPGCVDVSIDQAFSVVYLNAIDINNKKAILGGGSFTVRRGLPEFDNNATNYTVTITNVDDPTITGTVTSGPAINNSEVVFSVPQAGCYNVLVEDGVSCSAMIEICTFMEPPFTFTLPSISIPEGATACISAQVSGFEDIVGFQFGTSFDDSIVNYTSLSSGPDVPALFDIQGVIPPSFTDVIGIQAFDITTSSPLTLAEGDAIYDICFEAIGSPGTCSPIVFGDLPSGSPIEITTASNTSIEGNKFDETFIIFENGEICIESANLIVDIETSPDCGGAGNGSFTVTINEGLAPYTVTWQDTGGTQPVNTIPVNAEGASTLIPGLSAGDYGVTIVDSNNPSFTYTDSFTVSSGDLGVNLDAPIISCFGGMDGTVTPEIIVNGTIVTDISDYNFQWEQNGQDLGTDQILTNVGVNGTIFVTVTDDAGCEAVSSVSLSQAPELLIDSIVGINPGCPGGSDGEARAFISGGTAPYTFEWEGSTVTDPVLFAIPIGTYVLSVTDANGCGPIIDSVTLVDPPALAVNEVNLIDASCFNDTGGCDGEVTVEGVGGQGGPYNFIWSNGVSETGVNSSTLTGLCRGTYTVVVGEGNCSVTDTITIGSPDSIFLNFEDIVTVDPSCFGDSDGTISIMASGGTSGYTYNWDAAVSATPTPMVTGLSTGSYGVTILDANNCTSNFSLALGEPDPLVAAVDSTNSTPTVNCGGDMNATISVFRTGGNIGGQTTFEWSPNVSDLSIASGLGVGTYTVTITDEKGCSDEVSYSVTEPTPVTATVAEPAPPACAGDRTVLFIDSANGGSGDPYTFSINNGVPISIFDTFDVLAGEYLVSVFDANGCSYEEVVIIENPLPLTVDLGEDIEIQLGDNVQLDGFFFGPNALDSIVWTPNIICEDSSMMCLDPVVAPIETTEYSLTVFDELGCFASDEIIVEIDANRNVYIPNAFTPDADGVNDGFAPFVGAGVANVKSMKVFDRWGELVFQKDNFMPVSELDGWDGTFRNRQVQTGVYVYLIEVEFLDGVSLLYRGDILAIY